MYLMILKRAWLNSRVLSQNWGSLGWFFGFGFGHWLEHEHSPVPPHLKLGGPGNLLGPRDSIFELFPTRGSSQPSGP